MEDCMEIVCHVMKKQNLECVKELFLSEIENECIVERILLALLEFKEFEMYNICSFYFMHHILARERRERGEETNQVDFIQDVLYLVDNDLPCPFLLSFYLGEWKCPEGCDGCHSDDLILLKRLKSDNDVYEFIRKNFIDAKPFHFNKKRQEMTIKTRSMKKRKLQVSQVSLQEKILDKLIEYNQNTLLYEIMNIIYTTYGHAWIVGYLSCLILKKQYNVFLNLREYIISMNKDYNNICCCKNSFESHCLMSFESFNPFFENTIIDQQTKEFIQKYFK